MKRSVLAVVVGASVALGACSGCRNGDGSRNLSTEPNPPFKGELPTDPYVYKGEAGVYGGQLALALPSDPTTLNPITASGTNSTIPLFVHAFRCLVDYRNGDEPPDYDPGLCTKWESSPDAKQWTFYLRRGVYWSDGKPFTADDVVFTYNVICDPNVDTSLRDPFREGVDAGGDPLYPALKKLDDHTVRFELSKPNIAFLDAIYNLWLIPKHKWEQAWRAGRFNDTMKVSDNPDDLVSLGPFRLKEYVSGQRVVLERNPYFWKVDQKGQRLPYLDRIVFVVAQNFDTIQAKFHAGELDALWRVRADDYKSVKGMESPDVRVEDTGVSHDTTWLALNLNTGTNPKTRRPYVEAWKRRLFGNQKFRQALSFAIDREGLAKTVFSDRAVPIYSFISPGDVVWYTGSEMKYPYDPARARQLLGEIGLKDSNGDGVLEDQDGRPIEVAITVNSGNSQRVKTAALLVGNFKDIGINARPDPVPFATLQQRTQVTFDFDMVIGAWQSGTPPGPINTKNILLSSGQEHVCFPKQKSPATDWEAQIDGLVHRLDAALDHAERKRIYSEISRIWSEQLPEINLLAERLAVAYRSKFANVRGTTLFAHLTWNCEEIYIRR